MTKIFLLGCPGSGKGTVSRLLLDALGTHIHYYNVGGILREQASSDEHIKRIHAEGGLVDSDRVLSIFNDVLSQENYLCDGSPRKPAEADYILNHPQWKQSPGILIHLQVDQTLAQKRLLQRGRFDDSIEVIQNRFRSYNEDTLQSVAKFKEANRLINIDATATQEVVCNTVIKALSELGI